MKDIVNLLFEARKLKHIRRSGYDFLEAGGETVAEHSFMTAFIAFVMARIHPELSAERLTALCLLHDLPEARIGDLNYVQKFYVQADEEKAMLDSTEHLPFGGIMRDLVDEFNRGETMEAKLARDADQLSLLLDLKALKDAGHLPADKWVPHVVERLITETGKALSKTILQTDSDAWWLSKFSHK
ncbi:MAG: HD domain-containing protein [Desulfobacteraceae bacterium]|nr:HD domain-containing protein [Desulfobacteraceae bacterium]MBU4001156.1 HD domain-containing protein [Pseudomonadota bacterium]